MKQPKKVIKLIKLILIVFMFISLSLLGITGIYNIKQQLEIFRLNSISFYIYIASLLRVYLFEILIGVTFLGVMQVMIKKIKKTKKPCPPWL